MTQSFSSLNSVHMSLCPPFDFCPDGTNHSVTTVTLLNFCQNWVCYNSSQFGQNTPYIPWMIALMFLDCNVLQIRLKRCAKNLKNFCRINLLKTSIFGIISFKKISLMSPKSGDNLCAWLFTEAGQMLGRHIRALSRLVGAQIVYLKVEQPGL